MEQQNMDAQNMGLQDMEQAMGVVVIQVRHCRL